LLIFSGFFNDFSGPFQETSNMNMFGDVPDGRYTWHFDII